MHCSEENALDEWQTAKLKQLMSELWRGNEKDMTVDDIANRCLSEADQRIQDVGTQLYPFTRYGSYGRYFSGRNTMRFQSAFTVLKLDDLQGRKHLRQVVLLQLIYQIQREVYLGERSLKKIVIIEEGWDLLNASQEGKKNKVAVFIERAYRKFRKYGASVAIVTQSINDLYENPVGRAVAENSANMYLLGQTEEAIESVKRSGRLALAEGGFHLLKTVHTIGGVYSEIFVKSKTGIGVGRLSVNDFQKLLYSTHPDDAYTINQHRKNGLSVSEAISAVMESRSNR